MSKRRTPSARVVLRSALFALLMGLITPPYSLIALLVRPASPLFRYRVITGWCKLMTWLAWRVCGVRYRVEGREHMPATPAVILCKHQSAWETIALQGIFPPHVYVFKRELLSIPFFGWGLASLPMIAIDRGAGKGALAQVVEQGRERLAEGFWVVLFPEGTRVPPGKMARYKIGGAWLAAETGTPVLPVAHNAGECWPRNSFLKYPGEVVVSIGPPIHAEGQSAEAINAAAQAWIEGQMRTLSPHRYREAQSQPASA
ncbi:MAG: hypothetical protein RIR70_491 [Pseudomonadota bacterium]|jgi:1-acyl-sn-glycerol-3-phosphate acyltransferase